MRQAILDNFIPVLLFIFAIYVLGFLCGWVLGWLIGKAARKDHDESY